jgi:hypothetical protein
MLHKIVIILIAVSLLFSIDAATQKKRMRDRVYFDTIPQTIQVVQARAIPDTVMRRIKKDPDYWYANVLPPKNEKKAVKANKSLFMKGWFKGLVWLLVVGGFISFLFIYLSSSNIFLFRKAPKKLYEEQGDKGMEDIFSIDYKQQIQQAVNGNDYREAIRLLYRQTLKMLAESGRIDYKHGKTNWDYLSQLNRTDYYDNFFYLTRNFEYTWYGHFNVTPEGYAILKDRFSSFQKRVS